MGKTIRPLMLCLALLLLAALACGPSVVIDPPDVTIPAGVGKTAEAALGQVGELAGTAAAVATREGSAALATLQAADNPGVSLLREKLDAARPNENGVITLTITDDDVNRAIQLHQAVSGGVSTILNPAVIFTGGNIILTGEVLQPASARLAVTFRPYVEDTALKFEVTGATLEGIQVPGAVLSGAEATLNTSLGAVFNNAPSGFQLQAIIMGEGQMTVSGRRP